ncbi:alpha/beta fold hydrolase [Variovorax sp. SRS16]|uniref:alpha/beta fold hydrolase n=1 Tax=Variovorax sp. SRS16 TaxID=282217 RepID=UPI0013A53550|nr:alpha/beta hydrolase [Variovorax sp. SRS16]
MNNGTGAHVRANGIRQHYLQFSGEGRPVVIVPGVISPAILWRHVGAWFAETRTCLVVDVRGRGLSEGGAHLDYGLDACATDLEAFIHAKVGTPPLILGHSMGARIAARAVARAPDLAHSLVLVDPPTSGPGRRVYPIPLARTLGLLRAALRGEAWEALQASKARPWPEPLQQLRAEWLTSCDERAVHAAYEDFHGQDFFADLAGARVPISLICAEEGGVVSDADVEEMKRLRPDLHVTRLAGVGHQMQAENFAQFSAELAAVLRRHCY